MNFYRFFTIGVLGFIIDFVLFQLFYDVLQFKAQAFDLISFANVIAVAISTVFGYILNRTWSFENSADNVASQFGKYVGVAIVNNILNNILFGLFFYRIFGSVILNEQINSSISKFLSTSFQVITSYLGYKYVVFREEKEVISEALVP